MNHYLSMIFGCFIRKRRDLSLLFSPAESSSHSTGVQLCPCSILTHPLIAVL